jgi:hypothetical protein
MTPAHYEYTIRPGDSLTRIIHGMYGWTPHNQPATYAATLKGVLALNPHISNPDRITAGTILRLPEHPTSAVLQQVRPIILKQQRFVSQSLVDPVEKERVAALAWLAHNSNWLTIPGSVATGTVSGLLSPGNQQLLKDIGDLYAEYKAGQFSKATYQARRTQKIEQFKRNIGLFERLLYPNKGVSGSMRGNRNLLPPRLAESEVARLAHIGKYAARGGVVLTGVGVTAACMQIAHTVDPKEKNGIFVETVMSTAVGAGLGILIGAFLVSNPIGWGTALVLVTGSSVTSWAMGSVARKGYNLWLEDVDFVTGTGLDRVCR